MYIYIAVGAPKGDTVACAVTAQRGIYFYSSINICYMWVYIYVYIYIYMYTYIHT